MTIDKNRCLAGRAGALVLAVCAVAQLACTESKKKDEAESVPTARPVALSTGQIRPMDIASDGEYLYWTETGTQKGRIVRSSSDASSLAMLASDDTGPARVAVDDTYVYWSTTGGFARAPKVGGAREIICLWNTVPARIAAADGILYFTDPTLQSVVAAEPNKEPVVLAQELKGVDQLVLDFTNVFVTAKTGIFKIPQEGGEPTLVIAARKPAAIALEGKKIYFVADRELLSVPKSGGPTTTLAKDVGDVKRIVIHRKHVYLAGVREIGRVPLEGGDRKFVARVAGSVGNLVVLGDALYWNDYSSGRVFKLSLR